MKIIVPLLIIILIVFSCRKNDTAGDAVYGLNLHYVDSSNNDLYLVDGINGYWRDSIKVYDITTGQKKPLINCYENMYNFDFQQLNVLRTTLCTNTDIVNQYSYTLIHLKYGVDDTIKCHLDRNNITEYTKFDEILYNGIKRSYDRSGNITIMK